MERGNQQYIRFGQGVFLILLGLSILMLIGILNGLGLL